jgi:rhodanese-related sulfurtransferase
MKMEQTECSETLAYKIQTPGNYPEESIQHSEHGKSLKSRKNKKIIVYIQKEPQAS